MATLSDKSLTVYARKRAFNSQDVNVPGLLVRKSSEIFCKWEDEESQYLFDYVFDADSSQVEIYEKVLYPLLEHVLGGCNCFVFAYGPVGSGKSYTLIGDDPTGENSSFENSPLGLLPRAVLQFLQYINKKNMSYRMYVSFSEVHRDDFQDLLISEVSLVAPDVKKEVNSLEELIEAEITSIHDFGHLLSQAHLNQDTSNTRRDKSEVNTIYTITIREFWSEEQFIEVGSVTFVELACSEHLGKYKSANLRVGMLSKTGKALLTLSKVLRGWAKNDFEVPYNRSKLTNVLKTKFDDNTKVGFIATIAGPTEHLEKTANTLLYASKICSTYEYHRQRHADPSDDLSLIEARVTVMRDELNSITEEDQVSLTGKISTPLKQESKTRLLQLFDEMESLENDCGEAQAAYSKFAKNIVTLFCTELYPAVVLRQDAKRIEEKYHTVEAILRSIGELREKILEIVIQFDKASEKQRESVHSPELFTLPTMVQPDIGRTAISLPNIQELVKDQSFRDQMSLSGHSTESMRDPLNLESVEAVREEASVEFDKPEDFLDYWAKESNAIRNKYSGDVEQYSKFMDKLVGQMLQKRKISCSDLSAIIQDCGKVPEIRKDPPIQDSSLQTTVEVLPLGEGDTQVLLAPKKASRVTFSQVEGTSSEGSDEMRRLIEKLKRSRVFTKRKPPISLGETSTDQSSISLQLDEAPSAEVLQKEGFDLGKPTDEEQKGEEEDTSDGEEEEDTSDEEEEEDGSDEEEEDDGSDEEEEDDASDKENEEDASNNDDDEEASDEEDAIDKEEEEDTSDKEEEEKASDKNEEDITSDEEEGSRTSTSEEESNKSSGGDSRSTSEEENNRTSGGDSKTSTLKEKSNSTGGVHSNISNDNDVDDMDKGGDGNIGDKASHDVDVDDTGDNINEGKADDFNEGRADAIHEDPKDSSSNGRNLPFANYVPSVSLHDTSSTAQDMNDLASVGHVPSVSAEDTDNSEHYRGFANYVPSVSIHDVTTDQSGQGTDDHVSVGHDSGEETDNSQHYRRFKNYVPSVSLHDATTDQSGQGTDDLASVGHDSGDDTDNSQHYRRFKNYVPSVSLHDATTDQSGQGTDDLASISHDSGEDTDNTERYRRFKNYVPSVPLRDTTANNSGQETDYLTSISHDSAEDTDNSEHYRGFPNYVPSVSLHNTSAYDSGRGTDDLASLDLVPSISAEDLAGDKSEQERDDLHVPSVSAGDRSADNGGQDMDEFALSGSMPSITAWDGSTDSREMDDFALEGPFPSISAEEITAEEDDVFQEQMKPQRNVKVPRKSSTVEECQDHSAETGSTSSKMAQFYPAIVEDVHVNSSNEEDADKEITQNLVETTDEKVSGEPNEHKIGSIHATCSHDDQSKRGSSSSGDSDDLDRITSEKLLELSKEELYTAVNDSDGGSTKVLCSSSDESDDEKPSLLKEDKISALKDFECVSTLGQVLLSEDDEDNLLDQVIIEKLLDMTKENARSSLNKCEVELAQARASSSQIGHEMELSTVPAAQQASTDYKGKFTEYQSQFGKDSEYIDQITIEKLLEMTKEDSSLKKCEVKPTEAIGSSSGESNVRKLPVKRKVEFTEAASSSSQKYPKVEASSSSKDDDDRKEKVAEKLLALLTGRGRFTITKFKRALTENQTEEDKFVIANLKDKMAYLELSSSGDSDIFDDPIDEKWPVRQKTRKRVSSTDSSDDTTDPISPVTVTTIAQVHSPPKKYKAEYEKTQKRSSSSDDCDDINLSDSDWDMSTTAEELAQEIDDEVASIQGDPRPQSEPKETNWHEIVAKNDFLKHFFLRKLPQEQGAFSEETNVAERKDESTQAEGSSSDKSGELVLEIEEILPELVKSEQRDPSKEGLDESTQAGGSSSEESGELKLEIEEILPELTKSEELIVTKKRDEIDDEVIETQPELEKAEPVESKKNEDESSDDSDAIYQELIRGLPMNLQKVKEALKKSDTIVLHTSTPKKDEKNEDTEDSDMKIVQGWTAKILVRRCDCKKRLDASTQTEGSSSDESDDEKTDISATKTRRVVKRYVKDPKDVGIQVDETCPEESGDFYEEVFIDVPTRAQEITGFFPSESNYDIPPTAARVPLDVQETESDPAPVEREDSPAQPGRSADGFFPSESNYDIPPTAARVPVDVQETESDPAPEEREDSPAQLGRSADGKNKSR